MKRVMLAICAILCCAESSLALEFRGIYMCGDQFVLFKEKTVMTYWAPGSEVTYDYEFVDDEWSDVEGEMGFIISPPNAESYNVTITADNSDEFFVHEIGNTRYIPSLHFRKIKGDTPRVKETVTYESLNGAYYPKDLDSPKTIMLFKDQEVSICIENGENVTMKFELREKVDVHGVAAFPIFALDPSDQKYKEFFKLMKLADDSIVAITSNDHGGVFIRLDDESRYIREKLKYEEIKKRRNQTTNSSAMAIMYGATPLDLDAMYTDEWEIASYRFQSNRVQIFVCGVLAKSYRAYVRDDMMYLESEDSPETRKWKYRFQDHGEKLILERKDTKPLILYKKL